jgi:hypothetical protein
MSDANRLRQFLGKIVMVVISQVCVGACAPTDKGDAGARAAYSPLPIGPDERPFKEGDINSAAARGDRLLVYHVQQAKAKGRMPVTYRAYRRSASGGFTSMGALPSTYFDYYLFDDSGNIVAFRSVHVD